MLLYKGYEIKPAEQAQAHVHGWYATDRHTTHSRPTAPQTEAETAFPGSGIALFPLLFAGHHQELSFFACSLILRANEAKSVACSFYTKKQRLGEDRAELMRWLTIS